MYNKVTMQDENEVKILLPTECEERQYRFTDEIIKTKGKTQEITTIKRDVAIRFSGIENNLWRYQLICLDYKIEAKHLGSDTISRKKANVFNEIIIHVNQNGTIVSIINLKQLQDRWQIAKEELQEKHQGAVLEDFLFESDKLVENKENVLKHIRSKEMYGLYFNSCWGYHDMRKPRFEELTIHIEKRIQQDRHSQHLQKTFSHDATLKFKTATEQKKQESEFIYKNHQLQEAFLAIEEPNITSKYSVVCLK
jgi:hypothetical protein